QFLPAQVNAEPLGSNSSVSAFVRSLLASPATAGRPLPEVTRLRRTLPELRGRLRRRKQRGPDPRSAAAGPRLPMSVDMNSQGSDSNEEDYDPNCEEEEEEEEDPGDIEDYYVGVASDVEQQGADAFDPEEYQFTCLTYKESEGALHEHMTSLASVL
ncbi:hypothetical protein U0070_022251, partial [Myodes glareolus]